VIARAKKRRDPRPPRRVVFEQPDPPIRVEVEVDRIERRRVVHLSEDLGKRRVNQPKAVDTAPNPTRRQDPVGVVIVMQRQADLLEVVRTSRPARRFPRRLHRREQQCGQNADNRDHHQQLDQRERRPRAAVRVESPRIPVA